VSKRPPIPPPPLYGDELRVEQMVLNLLSNAVKFTPPGGKVDVTAEISAIGELVIAIADTGVGMAPEMIPLAMEPFRQVDASLARKFEGTGLGLPPRPEMRLKHRRRPPEDRRRAAPYRPNRPHDRGAGGSPLWNLSKGPRTLGQPIAPPGKFGINASSDVESAHLRAFKG
jgi:hypothetical protein